MPHSLEEHINAIKQAAKPLKEALDHLPRLIQDHDILEIEMPNPNWRETGEKWVHIPLKRGDDGWLGINDLRALIKAIEGV